MVEGGGGRIEGDRGMGVKGEAQAVFLCPLCLSL